MKGGIEMEQMQEVLLRIAESLESISEDLHKIKNSMCEEDGGNGIYIKGDIHAMTEEA